MEQISKKSKQCQVKVGDLISKKKSIFANIWNEPSILCRTKREINDNEIFMVIVTSFAGKAPMGKKLNFCQVLDQHGRLGWLVASKFEVRFDILSMSNDKIMDSKDEC